MSVKTSIDANVMAIRPHSIPDFAERVLRWNTHRLDFTITRFTQRAMGWITGYNDKISQFDEKDITIDDVVRNLLSVFVLLDDVSYATFFAIIADSEGGVSCRQLMAEEDAKRIYASESLRRVRPLVEVHEFITGDPKDNDVADNMNKLISFAKDGGAIGLLHLVLDEATGLGIAQQCVDCLQDRNVAEMLADAMNRDAIFYAEEEKNCDDERPDDAEPTGR